MSQEPSFCNHLIDLILMNYWVKLIIYTLSISLTVSFIYVLAKLNGSDIKYYLSKILGLDIFNLI